MPALLKELSSGAREEAHGIDIHSKHPHGSQGNEGGVYTFLLQMQVLLHFMGGWRG